MPRGLPPCLPAVPPAPANFFFFFPLLLPSPTCPPAIRESLWSRTFDLTHIPYSSKNSSLCHHHAARQSLIAPAHPRNVSSPTLFRCLSFFFFSTPKVTGPLAGVIPLALPYSCTATTTTPILSRLEKNTLLSLRQCLGQRPQRRMGGLWNRGLAEVNNVSCLAPLHACTRPFELHAAMRKRRQPRPHSQYQGHGWHICACLQALRD